MAGRKSTKPAAKAAEAAEVEAIEPKAEEIKTEEIAEPKAEEAKKAPGRKPRSTKAAGKAETAEPAKAEETKASAAKQTASKAKSTAKKSAEKCVLHVQYGGKSYSMEDLVKIAKDVWKYDLKRKVGELSDIELYVKPEESKVYYVMNGEFTGSFDI